MWEWLSNLGTALPPDMATGSPAGLPGVYDEAATGSLPGLPQQAVPGSPLDMLTQQTQGIAATLPPAPPTPLSMAPNVAGDPGGLQGAVPSLGASLDPRYSAGPQAHANPIEGAQGGSAGQGAGGRVPMPQPRPTGAGGQQKNPLDALRGLQQPARPDVVKPTTPGMPRPHVLPGGQLFQLLASLGATQGAPPLKLPGTLGQALGGR